MNTESLTRKVGPLPVWAWAALILAVVWFFFLRGGTASSAATGQDGATPAAASSQGGGASDSATPPPVDPGTQAAATSAQDANGGYDNSPQGATDQGGPASSPSYGFNLNLPPGYQIGATGITTPSGAPVTNYATEPNFSNVYTSGYGAATQTPSTPNTGSVIAGGTTNKAA